MGNLDRGVRGFINWIGRVPNVKLYTFKHTLITLIIFAVAFFLMTQGASVAAREEEYIHFAIAIGSVIGFFSFLLWLGVVGTEWENRRAEKKAGKR